MLKNKCCLYIIISIRFFPITICNLLIELPSQINTKFSAKGQTTTLKYEISTMWEMKSRAIHRKISLLLMRKEQVTGPKTQQAISWWWQESVKIHWTGGETATSASHTNGSPYDKHSRLHYQPCVGLRLSGAWFRLTEASVSDRTIKRPSADKVGTPTCH
jgi:hypothetical protein